LSAGRPGVRPEEATVRDAYDQVPYPSGSIPSAHPDNLATRALLFGLEPPDLRHPRVLELGCADGGNLLPMASELPAGQFLGIDLSPRQIAAGRERLALLGIGNVELQAMSLLDVDAALGEFDYILVHGVFSWVEPEVQEAVLRICRENLAPGGVAYVSYNTLPGWHQRLMLREMMLYHTRGVEDLWASGAGALELLDLVAGAATDDLHAQFLRGRLEHLTQYRERPSYLIHEYLEATNLPLYFHQFIARAGRHGLQYLADAEIGIAEIETLPPAVGERLRALAGDRLELEQYLDFVRNRTFRRTLLCRQGIPLELAMKPERMRRFHAASPVRPEAEAPDVRSAAAERFRGERDLTFAVSHSATKAVLVALAEAWPRALAFGELAGRAGELLGEAVEEALLADILFSLYGGGFLELHLLPPACTGRVSERPVALPLARREAALGPLVTNAQRRVLRLEDEAVRALLRLLDGTRDHAALREALARELPAATEALEPTLRKMAALALLVA
jgi:SAM-dependent methyltransferase